ncbi:hypothetical protein [Glycomyces dulcitolivorans]|uniref:hypothetical protein n=1 Tax=Glycomyces dulcitolivorans TaxID=2200759 RepID=UPI0013009440|nr:hypothetical protein [Glycomyces dulcitolivorans]
MVIPHHNGEVRPELLAMIRVYDPDYVVALTKTVADIEQVNPRALKLPVEEAERQRQLGIIGDHAVPDAAGQAAREAVVNICSPHRRREEDGEWDEDVHFITASSEWQRFTPVEDATNRPFEDQTYATVPEHWSGALGVALAARCGAARRPVLGAEPDIEDSEARKLWNWLLWNDYQNADGIAPIVPEMGTWDYPKIAFSGGTEFPPVFSRTQNGLIQVRSSPRPRKTADLVLGDTADDFALAHITERLYGRSVWVPRALWDQEAARAGLYHLHALVSTLERERRTLSISSLSESDDVLESMAAHLRDSPLNAVVTEPEQVQPERRRESVQVELAKADPESALRLVIAEQFDIKTQVGVHHSDRDSIEMTAGPRYPDITHPALVGCDELQWQVDVSFMPHGIPAGRGVDGHDLLASEENRHLTWVRSGRDGISFESRKWDFVHNGWSRASKLAEPRLRQPSLATWADLAAKSSGRSMEYSPAGSRFMSLVRLWGSAQSVAETMASPMLKVLKSFNPSAKSSTAAYPKGMGVVLASGGSANQPREGYLSFEGIVQFHGGEPEVLRDDVDALLDNGVLKRGLVLGCAHCRRVAFIAIDRLAQNNRCLRCDGSNPLTAASWNRDGIEPGWFYDLHPIVRDFLNENGDVPVLLSHHLRLNSRTYADAPEMELFEGGKRVAEADLIALSDRRLLVAEAKSSNHMRPKTGKGSRLDTARKKVLLATALHADEIVLATTQETWEPASIEDIQKAVKELTPAWTAPQIRSITALGTDHVKDEYLP